jgi:hypothetical protein
MGNHRVRALHAARPTGMRKNSTAEWMKGPVR